MSTLTLVRGVQAAVASALARGISLDQLESRLEIAAEEINKLKPPPKTPVSSLRKAPGPRAHERLSPVSTIPLVVTSPPTTAEAKQSLPRRGALPSSGLTPRKDAAASPTSPGKSERSPTSKSKLAPIGRADSSSPVMSRGDPAASLAPSASAPSLQPAALASLATTQRSPGSRGSRRGFTRTETAAALIMDSTIVRHEMRSITHDRCPADIFTSRLDELLRQGRARSQLEKDQKGLGNPSIALPLNLPDFEDEVKTRERRRRENTSF